MPWRCYGGLKGDTAPACSWWGWVVRVMSQLPLTPGERILSILWTESWLGPRANMDDAEARRKILYFSSGWNPSWPVHSQLQYWMSSLFSNVLSNPDVDFMNITQNVPFCVMLNALHTSLNTHFHTWMFWSQNSRHPNSCCGGDNFFHSFMPRLFSDIISTAKVCVVSR
jgi:hypothetical protein